MSVSKAVLTFALSGSIVLVLVGVVGVLVMQRVGQSEAISQAKDLTRVAARAVVQPRLTEGILRGDASSLNALDALVLRSVIREPIVRVKLWAADGTIVYSDEPTLIGQRFALGADELAALRSNEVEADVSDLTKPENRQERRFGRLLEVYLPVQTYGGTPLLFEAYIVYNSISTSAQQLWRAFLPVLSIALAALALLQIPLAYRLANRVRASQREREHLLQRAIDASDLERQRIAADLHDGPVQQLAGVSMSLAAAADRLETESPEASAALREAGARARQGVRSLRSSLMGIYPPSLERAGIASALRDLSAPLVSYGIDVTLDVEDQLSFPTNVESLLFRAAQEAIRNITSHADATNVRLKLERTGDLAVLEVSDDGRGFRPSQAEAARAEGHLGLQLLGDLARREGSTLALTSAPGAGTTVRVEVPL